MLHHSHTDGPHAIDMHAGLKQQQRAEDYKLQQLQAVLAQTQQELAQLPADGSYNNETSIASIKQQLEEAERDEQAARKELEELTEEAAQLRWVVE